MKSGQYWHVYHSELLTWCYDYGERAEYIKKNKPEHEIGTRLTLMQPVKGKLPKDLIKTGKAYDKVQKIIGKISAKTSWEIYDWETYNKAWNTRDELERKIQEATQANIPYLEELHTKECPCCWNGKELIFPDEE